MHGDPRPGPERHQHLHAAVIYDQAAPRAPHPLPCTAEALATGCVHRHKERLHHQAVFIHASFRRGNVSRNVVLFLVYETTCDCAHENVRKIHEMEKMAPQRRLRGLTCAVCVLTLRKTHARPLAGHLPICKRSSCNKFCVDTRQSLAPWTVSEHCWRFFAVLGLCSDRRDELLHAPRFR